VEEKLRAVNCTLDADLVKKVVAWFAEEIVTQNDEVKSELSAEATAQLGAKIPFLAKLLAKFCASIKAGSQHAHLVRQRLRQYPTTLIDMCNELLQSANDQLKQKGRHKGLLLIFDRLDRFEPRDIDSVLMGTATLTKRLASHAIYTIPLGLNYAPLEGGAIENEYGQPFVLPMVAIRKRHDEWRASVRDSPHHNTRSRRCCMRWGADWRLTGYLKIRKTQRFWSK
jgi:hypothetical protein